MINCAMNIHFLNEYFGLRSEDLNYVNNESGFSIYIPRLEARLERESKSKWKNLEEFYSDDNLHNLNSEEVYEFFIRPQYGTYKNRNGHIFWLVLPKSRKAVAIFLYPDKGYVFDKTNHTELIREYDKMDLNIIRSFVEIYQNTFRSICALQTSSNLYGPYTKSPLNIVFKNLADYAFRFTINEAKARTKEGRIEFGDIQFYKDIYYKNKYLGQRWNSNDLITDTDKINKANTPIGFKENTNTVSDKYYNYFNDIVFA